MTEVGPAAVTTPARRPPGRPPSEDPRSHVVRFRVTTAELTALQAAARGSVHEYARSIALDDAYQTREQDA